MSRNIQSRRTRKTKKKMDLDTLIESKIQRNINSTRVIKYFDTYLSAQNSTTTIGYQTLSLVPQGGAQSNRIGDTIWLTRVDFRFNGTTANSDIFATMRHLMFIWWQNTNSVSPGTSSILESTATYGTLSPLNFEGREYYSVIFDRFENFTGTATNPTTNSQICRVEQYPVNNHRIDFEQGSTSGTGHLYWMNVSDSLLAPHPVYTIEFRLWYYDD